MDAARMAQLQSLQAAAVGAADDKRTLEKQLSLVRAKGQQHVNR